MTCKVMAMPETEHSLHLELWPAENMTAEQRLTQREVELMVKAAFRQSADYPSVTRAWPQSPFSPEASLAASSIRHSPR